MKEYLKMKKHMDCMEVKPKKLILILFSTNLTLKNPENLKRFAPDTFDYIIIDETHMKANQLV